MQRISFNGAPLVNFLQTRDNSIRVKYVKEEQLAQFIPKFYIMAKEGITEPVLAIGESLDLAYGEDSFDITEKYFTHQTKYALRACESGMTMIERVVPTDALKATVTIFAVVKEDDVTVYKRNSNGSYVLPLVSDGTEPGVFITFASKEGITSSPYTMGDGSIAYPIFSLEAIAEGTRYNDIGLGIESLPATAVGKLYKTEKGYLPFKLSLYDKEGSKAKRISTTLTSDGVTGSLYDKARNPYTRRISSIVRNFNQQYFNTKDETRPYKMDLVSDLIIHEENIKTIAELIASKEDPLVNETLQTWDDGKDATTLSWFDYPDANVTSYTKLINLFNATSTTGVPYMATQIDTAGTEITVDADYVASVNFSQNAPIFMEGGYDGTIDTTMFNNIVAERLNEYGDDLSPLLDMLYNVESTFVDTGFPLTMKLDNFTKVLLHRPDVNVIFSTIDMDVDSENEQTIEEAKNMADAIMSKLVTIPESVFYNTGVMRAIIVGGNGRLADGSVFERYSQNYALFGMFSDYMGAGNGEWTPTKRFDMASGNIIKEMTDLAPAHIPTTVRGMLTDSQLVYSTRYNRSLYQFPAIQTVYESDSSVLNGALTMFGVCFLTKVGVRAHREFTGNQRLTKEGIRDSVVSFVNKRITGKFDDTFTIVPIVTFTEEDVANGYSWNLDIQITGVYMTTVQTLTITANSYN